MRHFATLLPLVLRVSGKMLLSTPSALLIPAFTTPPLEAREFKLFPEVVPPNPLPAFSTPAPLIPRNLAPEASEKKVSDLFRVSVKLTGRTSELKKGIQNLQAGQGASQGDARIKALQSATESADSVAFWLVRLRWLAETAGNRPAVEKLVKEAEEALAAYEFEAEVMDAR